MEKYIHLGTREYPLSLTDIQERLKRISFPSRPTDMQLFRYGYCRVHEVDRPEGYKISEGPPRLIDGRFYQTWKIDQRHDFQQLKLELMDLVQRHYHQTVSMGYCVNNLRLNIENNDDLGFVFLECLLLRDEDLKETVPLLLTDRSTVDVAVSQAITALRGAVKYKRQLYREFQNIKERIDTIETEDNYLLIKKLITTKGVFTC